MVYLKAIQKITSMDVTVSGTIDQKRISKNLGGFSPYSPPLDAPVKMCSVRNFSYR